MIGVLQRVSSAKVEIDGEVIAECGYGMLIMLGVEIGDNESDAVLLADKALKTRIFSDDGGKMNCSLAEISGEALIVPNFTLLASYRKGNRPDFMKAARPEEAKKLFEYFSDYFSDRIKTERGVFGADMKVSLCNDGPVTICMDSRMLRK